MEYLGFGLLAATLLAGVWYATRLIGAAGRNEDDSTHGGGLARGPSVFPDDPP